MHRSLSPLLVVCTVAGAGLGPAAAPARAEAAPASFSQAGPLAIRSVTPSCFTVERYGLLELRVDLSATYQNPFDPDEIDVTARVRAPSGRVFTVPGFLYQPYARRRDGNNERMTPTGPPEWRVRFAPTETGTHTCVVTARDRTGQVESQPVRFRVAAGRRPGFVRVSRQDPHYFQFDSGAPYFAIGANVCWAGAGGTYDYDQWFPHYAAAGCNYARLWLGPFDLFTLERTREPGREDTGLGRYDQANAWRLDYVLQLAERQGIYLMLCIDSFNSLRISEPYAFYATNPYRREQGGMLARPEEFFTNAEARRVFKNRLRYLVARYGYSPHVLSWEFWNEVDIIERYVSPEVRQWHQEMSRYVRGIDPWKHLQTTSYARSDGDPAVDGLPEMDYVQTHSYGARDIAAVLSSWSRRKRAFGKPHYVGEFGLDAGGPGNDRDPDGLSLHNGLWATVMSGDAGTGMLWWWDSYIEPRNLYGHFAALARFVQGIDWPRERFRPTDRVSVAFSKPAANAELVDLVLEPAAASWEPSPANRPNTFVIPRTGKVEGMERMSTVVHGVRNHPTLHNPATFEVDYARPGRFVVRVREVSGHGGAALKILLDGRVALEKDFPDTDNSTRSLLQYNGDYAIEVPAGRHTVVVENTGNDWFFASYVLPAYVESREPRLRAWALVGRRLSLAWVQHQDSTWSKRAGGTVARPVSGAVAGIPVSGPGRWRVEVWNTYTGSRMSTLTLTAARNQVTVPLPTVSRDVAIKAVRVP